MKKQITIRSLAMLALFTLLSFAGFSQVATSALQTAGNATLTIQKQKLDTLTQSARLQGTAANQVISTATLALINTGIATIATTVGVNTTTLTLIKKNNDTLAQTLRSLKLKLDSTNQYLRALESASVTVLNPSVTVSNPSVTINTSTLVLASITATASGTVTSGSSWVLMETSSDFSGTIDGVAGMVSKQYTFSVSNRTLPQIVYTISAGTIYIRKLN